MRLMLIAAAALLSGTAAAETASPLTVSVPLLPMPASIVPKAGAFAPAGSTLSYDAGDPGVRAAADRLNELLIRSSLPAIADGKGRTIHLRRDRTVTGGEAYKLDVTPRGVTIRASTDTGLYYGAVTLWQLIQQAGPGGTISAMTIDDAPAFAWRGVMLDSCRHFQPPAFIKGLIDRMALDKLNVLQWHLTDDQGWRLQIDRYPRLTEVGAWRQEAGAAGLDAAGNPVRYGGFYTKAEVREIVAYAAARHITIVPEIEMPGHASAAIAAYPELGSSPTRLTQPSNDWGILPNLFSTEDATFTFLENVLDEVMELFPSRYIHVGGDEATKEQWAANPRIQAKRTALGLTSDDKLQGWFTARIGAYIEKRGRRLIGWDEILLGDVPQTATIMSWRGMDGAITAAKAGHDAVLSPAPDLYLDNRQSDSADEPPGRGAIIDWKKLYAFDVAPPALTVDERKHLLGLQVNEWTEHARTTDYVERMIWPRAAILAELGWSKPETRDWAGFAPRLAAELGRYQALKLGYDVTPLVPQANISGTPGALKVSLRQQAGIGTIRYTTDGTAPTAASPAYQAPIDTSGILTAQAFLDARPLGVAKSFRVDAASLSTRDGAQLELCANKLPLRLEDDGPAAGPRAIHWVDIMQPCWRWRGAPLDGVSKATAVVGNVPFNFSIGDAINHITFRKPETPAGELEIRQDDCDGPVIAKLPLAPAAANSGVTTLSGAVKAGGGTRDLCITFTQDALNPLWVIDKLTLAPDQ
ncbi:family 20 glycosylhydrolase [Sphingomonas crusticola]|uniref:family 20 glycosylhydrolase n=1 Tax=Sphingomonas crusticola TaxID=1697973 RepID=UPI001F07C12D|nr:family 20 glycosylhydrolase [Sphingomonas crusticola]